ncbi:MAG: hypothetical protein QXK18_05065 [Candidatus Bathyarchaeia archaeon]
MNSKAATVLLTCSLLLFVCTCNVKAQNQTNMETFLDISIPGMKVQVNATSEAKPTDLILAVISLTSEVTRVYVKTMNLAIYGFKNGTEKTGIYGNATGNFELDKAEQYVCQHEIVVPENVYGIIYGEIDIAYNATVKDELGFEHPYSFQDKLGFTMTSVQNTYIKVIEEQLASLLGVLNQLNQTFQMCFGKNLTIDELMSLNQTYWQFKNQCESLSKVKTELDNTRATVAVLGVTTVIFFATTAYLLFRKPKSYW